MIAQLGGVVGSLGLGVLIVAVRRDVRIAALGAWGAGMVLLAAHLAPEGHHRVLAAAAVAGAVAAGALAWVFARSPWLLAVAALACVPARIPVHVGDTEANLLLPLYLVAVAAAIVLAWELFGEEQGARELGPFAWPLGLLVAWTGFSILWTRDVRQAAIELVFYLLPFGLLAVSLARLPWSRAGMITLAVQLELMALASAAVGLYQWFARDVFWNPGVLVANAYAPFYRVNSVFYDPSVYGRFLVVAILVALVVILLGARPRVAAALVLAIATMWGGLVVSFSQSSFTALIVGLLLAALLVWRRRALLLVLAPLAVVLVVVLSTPNVRHTLSRHTTSSWDSATSGRASLVANGVRIALDHPATGVGVGAFKRAYADRVGLKGAEPKRAASHNAAVTAAAETGLPGLALLLWLVGAAVWLPARATGAGARGRLAATVAVTVAAIAWHSLFYSALLEDVMFWGLLALGALAIRDRSPSATSAASTAPVSG